MKKNPRGWHQTSKRPNWVLKLLLTHLGDPRESQKGTTAINRKQGCSSSVLKLATEFVHWQPPGAGSWELWEAVRSNEKQWEAVPPSLCSPFSCCSAGREHRESYSARRSSIFLCLPPEYLHGRQGGSQPPAETLEAKGWERISEL